MRSAAISIVLLLAACTAPAPPPAANTAPAPGAARPSAPQPETYAPHATSYEPPPPPPVVSVYVQPPTFQPPPIAVGWAPPPMLVEYPPPPPFTAAAWIGGYWVWEGSWVWAHGHWMAPPRPRYAWVNPYYEHRDGAVIFIGGHWSPPGVAFVPPAPGLHLTLELAAPGVIPGPRPMGPEGIFVPAPPGSRHGIIIPAPLGTAPAVITSAPPVIAVGMRVSNNVNNTINNTRIANTTNNTTITNVTIVAPAGATASGKPVNASVPVQAHLAAALPPVVRALAPTPVSTKPIPAFVHGHALPALPASQTVKTEPAVAPHVEPIQTRAAPPHRRAPTAAPHAAPPRAVRSPKTRLPITMEPAKSTPAARPAARMKATGEIQTDRAMKPGEKDLRSVESDKAGQTK